MLAAVRSYELHASEIFGGFSLSGAEATEAPAEAEAEPEADAGDRRAFRAF